MDVFAETQHYSPWLIALISCMLLGFIFIIGRYASWDVFKRSTRNRGRNLGTLEGTLLDRMNKKLLFIIFAIPFLLFVVYTATKKLETRIDETGIHYKLFPVELTERNIAWDEIQSWTVINLSKSWPYSYMYCTYSVGDKYFLIIFLKNGQNILLGTKKPAALKETLRELTHKMN